MTVALLILLVLLIVFHRPLLLALGYRIALHYAAKENLKLSFRAEGGIFTNLTVRNLHAEPTGPSDIESVDVDLARTNYGFFKLLRHGPLDAISDLDVRGARVVINPAKGPKKKPHKKDTLYDFFPDRVHVSDGTVIVRDHPHDFVVEHADLDLDPHEPGELKINKLQLAGGQTWSKVLAGTTYTDRKLTLKDLVLSKTERIRAVSLDASKISARKLGINLDYPIGEGYISAAIGLAEEQRSINTDVHATAENIPAEVLNKYLALPEDRVRGQIDKLNIDLKGVINSPRTWDGKIMWDVRDLHAQPAAFDHGVFQIVAKNGTATVESGDIIQGQNQFHLRGSAELPAKIEEFGRTPAKMEMSAKIPYLKQATAEANQKLSGSAEADGKMEISGGKIEANFAITGNSIGFEKGAADKVTAHIKATKIVSRPRSPTPAIGKTKAAGTAATTEDEIPWFRGLKTETTFTVSNLKYHEYAADSVEGVVRNDEDAVTVDHLLVRRKQNELTAHGEYRLAADLSQSGKQSGKIDISLNAPEVGDYWANETPDKFTGPLQMNGRLEFRNGIAANGQFTIYGAGLKTRDLVFRELSSQIAVTDNVVYLNDFTASLNEHDFAAANGTLELRAPYRYRGKMTANIADLHVLEPLLRISGNQRQLGGSFVLNWEGTGEAKTFRNDGKLKLVLEKGRYGEIEGLQANVESSYTPEGLEIPLIFIANNRMNFQAIAQAKGETLEITKIELNQEKAKYASGYVSIPFVWKNIGTGRPLSPANGNVTVTFQSENLDLKKLFEDIGMKPAASGSMNVKMDARGTLGKLDARVDVEMRELRQPDMEKFEPASVDLSMIVHDNELNVAGRLQQAKIQPLEVTAKLPFDAAKVAEIGHIPEDTPVTAKAQLPRSSVNFIRQFTPELQQIDGDMALNVDVSGTIGKPVLSGAGDITINVARSTNTTIPALTNFKARLDFHDDALTLQQFGGDLSGGKFTMTGGVKFPKLTQPELDLTFKAESALIARNDSVTARADADVKITGPLASASVTGTVATTNSNFLKNIDLLPIGLPGRPPPQPPESRPEFSFPQVPIRDWKFDVVLKTKDPFKIRGNLAYGGAIADMHLIGTGLHPGLQGQVRLENVEATLPFSRLEIAYGFLYFDPSDSLNPKMDLHGRSVIRDYTIHVYIYGTTLAPEAVFSSEPPLPQEEIISLLATGTTRAELTGNNNVLAGRAATLLVQQLYRKIFKKGGGAENTSVFDRLDLEVGQTDPRTGQQQATARFKLNDQFVLLGDVDVGGGFKGMVKYLIRFH